jgi:hypothetical protein
MQVSEKITVTPPGRPPVSVQNVAGPSHGMPPAAAATSAEGGQPAVRPPFPFAFPPGPDPSDLIPVVISPSTTESLQKEEETTTAAAATPLAFIFLPGAFMYPKDYAALATELKTAFKTLFDDANLAVYLVFAVVDWTKINPASPGSAEKLLDLAIEQALQSAADAGFTKSSSSPSGRLDNVFIGMHSMSVLAASGFAFHRSAGAVLFGASMIATDTFWPSIHTYPRPLLHIFGEMDGQAHLCRASLSAAEAALSAPSLGRKTAAREHPIALIEGMNHAQFSNNKANYVRGDLDPFEKEQKDALAEVAVVVAAFLTAHSPNQPSQNAKIAAIDVLDDVTMHAARHFTPYLRALGRTAAEDLLNCTEGACTTYTSCYGEDLAHPLAYSHGAEYVSFDAKSTISFTAHPGELHTAERFAIRAQKQLFEAAGLSTALVEAIPVAAVAHTSKQSFTYSQPVILQCKDAPHGFVVKIQVLLQREAYPEQGSAATRSPIASLSPTYALKLKSGEQIAYALKEMSSSLQNPEQLINTVQSHKEKVLSTSTSTSQPGSTGGAAGEGSKQQQRQQGERGDGSRLSAETYEEALVLVGARAREIFQKRGFELMFKEDARAGPSGPPQQQQHNDGAAAGEEKTRRWERTSDWIDAPITLSKDTQYHSTASVDSMASTLSITSIVDTENKSQSSQNKNKVCTAVVPSLYVDARGEGPFDEGPSRFAGGVYFKAPSLAWCIEWILVAGLRNQ